MTSRGASLAPSHAASRTASPVLSAASGDDPSLPLVLCSLLQRVLGTQTVTDVRIAATEVRVLVDEVLVYAIILDDVVRDVIEYREVGLWRENHAGVGQVVAAMLERRKNSHLDVRRT